MPMKVNVKQWQRGPTVKLIFSVVGTAVGDHVITESIPINGLALVRFKFDHVLHEQFTLEPSVTLKKTDTAIRSNVQMSLKCDGFERQWTCSSDWLDYVKMRPKSRDFAIEIAYCKVCSYNLEMDINVVVVTPMPLECRHLYGNAQGADFRLSVPGGAVMLHKFVLAAHSNLFDNKETSGHFSGEGVTMQALQDLKTFLYLGTLPDRGLEPLLIVAANLKMKKLKADCVATLARTATPERLSDLINFAIRNDIPELVRAMLHLTSDSVVHAAYQINE